MADTIATYKAEGWVESSADLNYKKILDYATKTGLLPLDTEAKALAAATEAYGWGHVTNKMTRRGQIEVVRLSNWEWFRGWLPGPKPVPEEI